MNNSEGTHGPGNGTDPEAGHDADHDDEDLRIALRGVDPAAHLPDVDPAWTTWKVRQTMTTPTTAPTPSSAAAPGRATRNRRRLFAGAGLGTAAAGLAAAFAIGTSGAAVTALTVPTVDPAAPAAMCAQLTPQLLAQHDLAFEAQVTSITDGTVTLEVTHRYKGDVGDEVTVPQQPADQLSEFGPGSFTDGASYLITTTGAVVSACGASGPSSPELQALYEQAFPA